MKKFLSALTAALFTFGAALPSFADDLPDLYPAPPLEKPVNNVQKNKKVQKANKAGKAKKAIKQKASKVRKASR